MVTEYNHLQQGYAWNLCFPLHLTKLGLSDVMTNKQKPQSMKKRPWVLIFVLEILGFQDCRMDSLSLAKVSKFQISNKT